MPERGSRANWLLERIFPEVIEPWAKLLEPLNPAIEQGLWTNRFRVLYVAKDGPYSIQFVLFSA